MDLPILNEDFANFKIRTEKRRHLRMFNSSWATYTISIHDLEYWQSTDPLDVLRHIFKTFLDLLTEGKKKDVFQIAIIGGETLEPVSTRFLPGFEYTADTILDRFGHISSSHEELNLGEPFSVDVTHVHTPGVSDETLSEFARQQQQNDED